jgi:hypothetical protein
MAKFNNKKRHETGNTITTPSQYGSHKSMVVDPEQYVSAKDNVSAVSCGPGVVLCKDDKGFYITLEDRLDSGLADPKRYSGKRLNLVEKDD